MMLKYQAPVPGEQPSVGFNSVAIMRIPTGTREGVIYVQQEVTVKGNANGYFPLLSDIAHATIPLLVKIGGNIQITRTIAELIALNKLQDANAAGSVAYYQNGTAAGTSTPTKAQYLVATVNDASNAVAPAGVNTTKDCTAVFQIPIYFAEYWRKSLATAEALALPTSFIGGGKLKELTVEVPTSAQDAAVRLTSGAKVRLWHDYDNLQWPPQNNQPLPFFTKKGRFTKLYSATGDVSLSFTQKDRLLQFSVLAAAGDTIDNILVKKNGETIRQVDKRQNDQTLLDHGLNVAGIVANRFDLVFDVNDDPTSGLPLAQADTFEVTVNMDKVAGAANLVLLTESYGQPD